MGQRQERRSGCCSGPGGPAGLPALEAGRLEARAGLSLPGGRKEHGAGGGAHSLGSGGQKTEDPSKADRTKTRAISISPFLRQVRAGRLAGEWQVALATPHTALPGAERSQKSLDKDPWTCSQRQLLPQPPGPSRGPSLT